jgi:LEA14-like dessication related protein
MRNTIIFISFLIALVGCSTPKTPDFKKIKNARVTNVSGKLYTVTADAVYNNPNSIGGNLVGMEMDVIVDDVLITHLSQTKSAVIQPETDFEVPITFDADITKIIGENKGFLKGMLDKLLKEEVDVNYKGHLEVQFLKKRFKIPVDYTEAVAVGVNFD